MATKIAVITDVHANLPALQAVLQVLQKEHCDQVIHTGDAIGIGPYPVECLNLLLDVPNISFIMGNHDAWFVQGLPSPRSSWMSEGEYAHHHWTHARLTPQHRSLMEHWPYVLRQEVEGVTLSLIHI